MVTLFNMSESHFQFRSRNKPTSFQVARGQHKSTQSNSFFLHGAKMERSTLSAPNASFAQMFVPAVFDAVSETDVFVT